MSDSSYNTIFLGMYNSFDKRHAKMASKLHDSSLKFTPLNKQNFSRKRSVECSLFTSPSRSKLSLNETDLLNGDEGPLLKRKLKEKDADLELAQAKIIHLEDSIKSQEPEQKKKLIFMENELEKYKSQLLAEKNKVESYKIQLNNLIDKDESRYIELNEIKEKYDIKCKELEQKFKNELQKNKVLQENLDAANEKLIKTIDLEKKNAYLDSQLKLYSEKLEEAEQKLKDMFEESKEKLNKISQLQINLKEALNSNKILQNKLAEIEEKACVEHAFQDEIIKIPEMKRNIAFYENKIKDLEKAHSNSYLLQEKIYDLESQLDRERKKLENSKKIIFENEILHRKIQEWESLFSDEDSTKTPSSLLKKIQEIQAREALLTEEIGSLKSELNIKISSLTSMENKIVNLNNELDKKSKLSNDQASHIKRLQRKLLLVSKERDSFKKILDSYENEVTTAISSHDRQRIETLENILAGYKATLDQYGFELPTLPHFKLESSPKNEAEDVKQLKDEITQRDLLIEDLKKRLEGGSYALSDKVVHLSSNPLNKAHSDIFSELENLRKENSKLLEKVKSLESPNNSLESTDISHNQPKLPQNLAIDDTKGLNPDLRYKRIVDAFKQKSQEFREACYLLTGFKIDSMSQNKYKLSHIYAESPNDYLLFERNPKKKMLLLETEYSLTLTDLIDTYLKTHDSIPAFLSSLTLNLFNQQTCVMK